MTSRQRSTKPRVRQKCPTEVSAHAINVRRVEQSSRPHGVTQTSHCRPHGVTQTSSSRAVRGMRLLCFAPGPISGGMVNSSSGSLGKRRASTVIVQGTFGGIQGTFGGIQGTFGGIQGTFGGTQGTFGGTQGTFSNKAEFYSRYRVEGKEIHTESEDTEVQSEDAELQSDGVDSPSNGLDSPSELKSEGAELQSELKSEGAELQSNGVDSPSEGVDSLSKLNSEIAELQSELKSEDAEEKESGFATLKEHPERLMGAISLITGGTIGAGIIALPVKTVAAGFLPSSLALVMCWAFMVVTACLLIELTSWYEPGTNFVTMAERTLGVPGKVSVIVLYSFIYVATLTAYIAEGSRFLTPAVVMVVPAAPQWAICSLFTAVLSAFIYAGTAPAEKLNSACLAIAVAAFAALVVVGIPAVNTAMLMHMNWQAAIGPLPIMIVAFTFHNMIPSLMMYLGSARLLFKAVFFGSLIPLGLYTLWQAVILGAITDPVAMVSAEQVVQKLAEVAGPQVVGTVQIFSFFAIVTSFLGIALGCVDFLTDLIYGKLSKESRKEKPAFLTRGLPMVVMLAPAFAVSLVAPAVFLPALEYSGSLRLILFGIMPALMVWCGRYAQAVKQTPWVRGGKNTLVAVVLTTIFIMALEVGRRLVGV
eukprot:CAMPEP_0198206390 /NCGR_PEP_ID=MMETSP1445-20131203/9926_1 /TAXON_ID=36898 /ORGANISM="Pyramimonas sp., Strain CCMP2087" /LENGTH=646 /DNA_ID=CAMNT_0043879069 /DNA_START=238 /DNA_END=2178 /DNA_ORIENTATION=-